MRLLFLYIREIAGHLYQTPLFSRRDDIILSPTYPLSGDNVGPPYSTPSHGGILGHSLANPIHSP